MPDPTKLSIPVPSDDPKKKKQEERRAKMEAWKAKLLAEKAQTPGSTSTPPSGTAGGSQKATSPGHCLAAVEARQAEGTALERCRGGLKCK